MKTVSIITVALLALVRSAPAQIDLTWDNCVLAYSSVGEPFPSANQDFDCTTPETYKLHGSFKTPVSLPNFVGMDITIDLMWTDESGRPIGEALRPFWHYEPGGCNVEGVLLSVDKSVSGGMYGACGLFATPWGPQGQSVIFSQITNYSPDFSGQPGRARLVASIARPTPNPYSLQPGVNYYGFHLEWTTARSGDCLGCTDRMVVQWSSAVLYDPTVPIVTISGPSQKTPAHYASINGPIDIPDPVVSTTWGQIKSLYRGSR